MPSRLRARRRRAALVLEEKVALGLAAPPAPRAGGGDVVARALEARAERARTEKMTVRAVEPDTPWTDYTVTSAESGKTYRVALRSEARGDSYCSCPDFRKNTLGTCKHILHVLAKARRRFGAAGLRTAYVRADLSVHLRYGEETELRVAAPDRLSRAARAVVAPVLDRPIDDVRDLVTRIARLERLGEAVTVYPDAEEYLQQRLFQDRIRAKVDEIRADPAGHPLRRTLLRAELLPYQLDGIAFAVGAGRAVLADDMGLGKTIQAIGVAELLAREADVQRVLIICPASVKAQWRGEIERFSDRTAQIVLGGARQRAAQYAGGAFFTICNYEQVLRDLRAIERARWDLIVLDEGQRIKNWEAKTSDVIKGLRSRFALVLSGTPLENRLDELYSVVEFIDDRRLGPAFRFFDRHRVVDPDGKVLGYHRLDELRARLAPVLLRRTRASVAQQLPPRTTEIVRIAPTAEQLELHDGSMRTVAAIVRKPYLTEMDLLRLRKALQACRMAADSTFLVDKRAPGHSSKLRELESLLVRLCAEGRKIVLFSEWTTMLDLIEPVLRVHGLRWVRLDGSVPQKQRQQLVHQFQRDPACRLFLTTNAGSTSLNLQAADTVVNVDLPWNPAVLEQRIGRAHRMGQQRPVHAYLLVTAGTIEENLLATLSAKHELALAALDPDSDVDHVHLPSGMTELKRRLEVLLGARPAAPIVETDLARAEAAARQTLDRKQRLADAGGQLVTAALRLIAELLPAPGPAAASDPPDPVTALLRDQLAAATETDPTGRPVLTIPLPDPSALDTLARSLATSSPPRARRRRCPTEPRSEVGWTAWPLQQRIVMRALLLLLSMLLSSSFAIAYAAPPDGDALGSGPFARMEMKLERTIFGVDVARVELRFDEATAGRFRRLAAGRSYSDALADRIARAAIGAQGAQAELTFLRDVSLGQFLDSVQQDLERARDAGLISQENYQRSWARVRQAFAPLSGRGFAEGDRLIYRARRGSLRTILVSERGQVLLDETDDTDEARRAMLAGYFASGGDFREPLIRSLFD